MGPGYGAGAGLATAAALTDGSQKAIMRGGAKGATTAADITSANIDADTQAAHVAETRMPLYEDYLRQVAAVHHRPLASGEYAWSVDRSTALEASTITKDSAGCLRRFRFRLDSTAGSGTYYLQILNASAVPADASSPTHLIAPIKVIHANGTDDLIEVDLTDNCIYASTGIVFVLSSTEFTKTGAGSYLSGTVLYK